jgi:hypothetical protein
LAREIRRGRGYIERERGRIAVAGRVERALLEPRIEEFVEGRPAAARLCETVHENNPVRHGDNRRLAR